MLSVEPPARPRTLANPAHGAAAVAVLHSASQTRVNALETTATHEAAEHEFEIARLVRIARANRHAETEG